MDLSGVASVTVMPGSERRLTGGKIVRGARRMSDFREKVQKLWDGDVQWDCSMARFSTLRVGGSAGALIEPTSVEELVGLIAGLRAEKIDFLVVGGGSNILVVDQGYPGVVLHLGRKFADISKSAGDDGEVLVTVEAGCSLARLVNWCLERELSGLEFAAGIPGSIGGAVVMNAGAWGSEIGALVRQVTVIDGDGNPVNIAGESIPFVYRSWGLINQVAAVVTLRLEKGSQQEIRSACYELAQKRQETQPMDKASAGSFFKNPASGEAAGKLIEDAGLKGWRVGDALVSPKHANFLINMGHASAADFLELMRFVQEKVYAESDVWLEPEVRIVGGSAK